MAYPVENALFQWEDGERRLAEERDAGAARALDEILEALRKRLGSSFGVEELAELYASGPDLGPYPAWLVDAAFGRYAREAADFAGGRRLTDAERHERTRPD